MGFKELLQKLKTAGTTAEKKKNDKYPNRFLKFYHTNKERLLKERKSTYMDKKKQGVCVRCGNKALEGIVFCEYHQQKQIGYNQKARTK
ncbi:MAG: hypothetical protein Q7S55_02035 [Nanoarchaeota archaeon]|nr:hypothetical protein [Nanoarchaeota archaeon]